MVVLGGREGRATGMEKRTEKGGQVAANTGYCAIGERF